MPVSGNLATEERLAWISTQLEQEGAVRIAVAARELRVSEMTIRRDLRELEATGVARRVRGGAVTTGPVAFPKRHRHRAKAKAQIAAKLLPLVPSVGAIGLDASSTVLRLATAMENARDLTVLTNGLETFEALHDKPGIHAILTGGGHDQRTGSLVGPVATRTASSFLFKRLFISAAAVDTHGPSEAALEEAEVKRAMASVAAEVIVAADSSKLDSQEVALSLDWSEASLLVTELDPSDSRLDRYRAHIRIL